MDLEFKRKTEELIDNLKAICGSYGLGNDGNEFKIITQVFLYKFMNDKFGYEIKQLDERLKKSKNWEQEIQSYSDNDYEMLLLQLGNNAKLQREQYLSAMFNRQNEADFAKLLDDTLINIANDNNDIFSVKTETGAKVQLFDRLSNFITDPSKRDDFARAIISKLFEFNFEQAFTQKYDYFATIFEYLIKDYNKDGGGKYAEYYTPHAVARIMANILIGKDNDISNVTCYDPSAGSGTLLMSIAHAIGEDKCTIYSQDISQKSSSMLRLNLILNNLVHSIPNIIQGNTLSDPYHIEDNGNLKKFDYIVSNPPFKLDFSDYRDKLDSEAYKARFFAGIPNIPPKDKDSMPIYLMFLQHIIYSLNKQGKAAVVVPNGFTTDSSPISLNIRKELLDNNFLDGVIVMPPNIFANTNTSVSVLIINKMRSSNNVILIDASKLGQVDDNSDIQKNILSLDDEKLIYDTYFEQKKIPEFSTIVDTRELIDNEYLIKPGLYFNLNYNQLTEYVYNQDNEFKKIQNKLNGLKRILHSKIERNCFLDTFVNFTHVSNFKDTEIGKIPENWDLYSLQDLLLEDPIGGEWGKEFSNGNYNHKIKCIRGTDIPNIISANYDKIPTRYVKREHIEDKCINVNDIIIEISGGSPIQSTGRICFIDEDIISEINSKLLCTNFCRILRFKNKWLAKIIYCYLLLLYQKGYFFNLENNTTNIKNLLLPVFIKNIKIPLPKTKQEEFIRNFYINVNKECKLHWSNIYNSEANLYKDNLSEEKIIKKSLEFWKTHGKMDIDKFARENGILVYKDNEQKKGAVSYNAAKDLYEIAVKDPRDNFTIAHEIGHILKHKKELKTGTLGRKSEESGSKIMEYEADFLAAEILMPEEYVMKYLKEYNISNKDYLDEKFVKSCAKNFDVTPPAMNIRLKNLGYKVPYLK